jgi:tRNA threonylcarbamoyladenosine biosynthesis protein TsaE
MCTIDLWSDSVATTQRIAVTMARELAAGTIILLHGEMGAGKTTWTRGFLAGLDHPDPREVASPTFALHHRYEGGRVPLNHLDLFRVQDERLLIQQGVLEALEDTHAITVVEWPNAISAPPRSATLHIELRWCTETERYLRCTYEASEFPSLLGALLRTLRA